MATKLKNSKRKYEAKWKYSDGVRGSKKNFLLWGKRKQMFVYHPSLVKDSPSVWIFYSVSHLIFPRESTMAAKHIISLFLTSEHPTMVHQVV